VLISNDEAEDLESAAEDLEKEKSLSLFLKFNQKLVDFQNKQTNKVFSIALILS
jgi:hypothetical protein